MILRIVELFLFAPILRTILLLMSFLILLFTISPIFYFFANPYVESSTWIFEEEVTGTSLSKALRTNEKNSII